MGTVEGELVQNQQYLQYWANYEAGLQMKTRHLQRVI